MLRYACHVGDTTAPPPVASRKSEGPPKRPFAAKARAAMLNAALRQRIVLTRLTDVRTLGTLGLGGGLLRLRHVRANLRLLALQLGELGAGGRAVGVVLRLREIFDGLVDLRRDVVEVLLDALELLLGFLRL